MRVAGEFTWDKGAPASLVDIDLSVPAGALVAVVGQTGSGKSSLLAAALGLMQQVQGPDVLVRGKVRPSADWPQRNPCKGLMIGVGELMYHLSCEYGVLNMQFVQHCGLPISVLHTWSLPWSASPCT